MAIGMELNELKGVGPARLKALHAASVFTAADLLSLFPVAYLDTTAPQSIPLLRPGEAACVEVVLAETPRVRYQGAFSSAHALAQGVGGTLRLTWFNQPWIARQVRKNDRLLLYGKAERYQDALTMVNPVRVDRRGILPRYAPLPGMPGKVLGNCIAQALEEVEAICPETLSAALMARYGLMSRAQAVRMAHLPTSMPLLSAAKRRIGFENLLLYQLSLRSFSAEMEEGIPIPAPANAVDRFWSLYAFTPTGAQRSALDAVVRDMAQNQPMRRLVQGDVGAGKTAVAFGAVFITAKAGYQSALMAPTEILARQHYENARRILAPAGITCGLLLGSMRASERKAALAAIASGAWQLVIGTHALISAGVGYKQLALVITDEQHRFGVRQRGKLSAKAGDGATPHVLVMSATPIPRTLALVLYGDLNVTVIDEMPPNRTPVRTHIVPEHKRQAMYGFLRDRAALGEQAYLVCPLVEDSSETDFKSAQAMYRELQAGALKGLRLGLTYGSQPPDEKDTVLRAFSTGAIDVLVATTVIEVGVDVPNATVMIIENADRFGLSQLHQLRGRVGRGNRESWCFLFGEANERLDTLCATNDGFIIAQKDLEQRGPGDFLGTRQHGDALPGAFGVGNMALIEETQRCVDDIMRDPALRTDRDRLVALAIQRFQPALRDIVMH